MKMHLPLSLRGLLLAALVHPAFAALTWDSGAWNDTDSSWINAGTPAVFTDGDAVEFTAEATSTYVMITQIVQPASIVVSGAGYVFDGSGSIGGSTSLSLESGASLTVNNVNTFSGGTTVADTAHLRLAAYNAAGTVNEAGQALGRISGSGTVELSFLNAGTMASIQGDSLAAFSGTLNIQQGNVGLGRLSNHSGAGASANLGAAVVNVSSNASFIVSLGWGQGTLETGNEFTSDVRTETGATLGNRDGHVNWTGNVYLNMQDVSAADPVYNSSGSTGFAMHYGKFVVWDGIVSGAGTLELTSGAPDGGNDHRLVLTNTANDFNGTYRIAAAYRTSLALASPQSAASAGIELGSDNSRLVLMGSDATVASLNGSAGVVLAEGNGHYVLTVGNGDFNGAVQDAADTPPAGLNLGITKSGSGILNLVGANCSYTGATTVQGGTMAFSGDVSLGDISVESGALLQTSGDLSLRSGAVLQLALSTVESGGSLVLADAVHAVKVMDYESFSVGSYDLLTWSNASSVTSGNFSAQGLNATAEYTYTLHVNGNALQLVVGNMADVDWLWSGGSATWSDTSAAEWSNTGGGEPAGQVLNFGPLNAGSVTIDRVTPASVLVMGGEYTFVAADDASVGIVSSGHFTVSGDSTVVNLNLDNSSLTGVLDLQGGTLVLGEAQAIGSASIGFNGGQLRYGAGVNTDLSAQVLSGSVAAARVDTNGNDVLWASADGVKHVLQLGVEKNGAGSLQLVWAAAGETYNGFLQVNDGELEISKTSGNAVFSGGFGGSGDLILSSASGQLTVQGDNSAFTGVVHLVGDGAANSGSVSFGSGASLGGSSTLVKVAGQRFWFASNTTTAADFEIVDGTTTYFDGSTGASYSFSGAFTGSGSLILKPSCNMAMSGDVSAFTGVFTHPGATAVNWVLGGQNIAGSGSVQATLDATGSNMTYILWYSAPTTLSGAVTGAANLQQRGAGELTLTGQNTSSGQLAIDSGCEVILGTSNASAAWAGAVQTGAGQFTLVNGTLAQPLTTVEGSLVVETAADATVDLGGTSAAWLKSIRIDAGGRLIGVAGDVNIGTDVASLSLSFSASNVGETPVVAAGKQSMLEQENGALIIYDTATVSLDNEAIKSIIQGERQAVYLHVTNADIQLKNGISASDLFANSATTPEALGLTVLGVEQGNIVLEGAVVDVYMVTENGDYPTVTSYTKLQDYKATYVDSGYTLSLQLPGDNTQVAWVNNLLGAGDFSVTNTDEASGVLRVLLNNAVLGDVDSSLTPEQEAEINTANTLISGNITAGNAVQLVKTGSGTLTVGGVLSCPWLELDEGTLKLLGQGNAVEHLEGDASLVLAAGSSLGITGDSLEYTGSLSGSGKLELNGSLSGRGSVGALNGTGSLQSSGQTFYVNNVQNSTFSGSLSGSAATPGVLAVASGAGQFTMNQVQGTNAWTVQNTGALTLQQNGPVANAVLTLGGLELLSGSTTTIIWNSDWNNDVLYLGKLVVEDDASVTLKSVGSLPVQPRADGTLVLGQVQEGNLGADGRAGVALAGDSPFRGVDSAWLSVENGYLLLHTLFNNRNDYAEAVSSHNARTGAVLLWNLPAGVVADSQDLAALTVALDALLASGDSSAAEELMAAAAGSGIAVLADASAGDMERQLKSIRNRTVDMGLPAGYVYDNLPRFNAWVNAEGDRRKLQKDGTDSGYSLSSWGGTVGVDMDFSTSFTAGFAFSAMYGDLECHSSGVAKGDMNHYYLTLFGKYTHRRWHHTLVGAIGRADVDMKRHVYFGTGSYHTKGSTDGMSFGLLYELSYDIPLLTTTPAIMQPVFNVSYRHAGIDAYSEHGSDAALHFGKQDMDVVTFGLGLRVHTTALETLYNRSCPVHVRFLAKADAGDTRGHTNSTLLSLPARSGRIRTAEEHRFGLEMGIGITIPIGVESGALFLDCGYENRFDESEVNGTVGYRLSF